MSLKNIKIQVQQYTGLDPTDTQDNALMLQLINAAALEIYNSGDLPGLLDEAVFTFDPNYQIAIPNFASNIRGLREYYSQEKQALVGSTERYKDNPWFREWERWRIKTNSPLLRDIANAGTLTITAQAADNGTITITGSTAGSSRISETVTMNAASKTTIAQFTTVHSITSTAARTYNYSIADIMATELAVLANNEFKTNYQIFLLSSYPWTSAAATQTMEFLYKRAFVPFVNDGDEFPAIGYDDAIYHKFQSNWDSTRKGDEKRSLLANAKADVVLQNAANDRGAKEPDSRIIVVPTAGQRIQRRLRAGISPTNYNVFRP